MRWQKLLQEPLESIKKVIQTNKRYVVRRELGY